ncbi:MAG TPA: ABC transporter ATP-binding protein [Thermoanaerobaculia bacterium]|nr:ABC transporter ATP-binding protein [Thermoanaerobaculia bacterium]
MPPIPLRVADLVKHFGSLTALDGVSLELSEGEILGLLGPNGAGKTTLVRAIAGRVIPEAGSVSLFGVAAAPGDSGSRQKLGWVPQEIALYPLLSVRENLQSFGRFHGLLGPDLDAAIDEALHWSGLADRAGDRTKNLSGGMKRRLNMAAGVIHRPALILMDEPTVGVDPQSREKIYAMIEELRRGGVSIIYTTHYMEEAERLCDRIAIIDRGKIIADGSRDELLRSTIGLERELTVDCGSAIPEPVRTLLSARGATVEGQRVRLPVRDTRREMEALLQLLDAEKIAVDDLSFRKPNLEAVFLHLTGRGLRE